jgi:hypothetical protein
VVTAGEAKAAWLVEAITYDPKGDESHERGERAQHWFAPKGNSRRDPAARDERHARDTRWSRAGPQVTL